MILSLMLLACSEDEGNFAPAIEQRDSLPILKSRGVSTLISDSGITRYRIETPQWLIYDRTEPPYQEFPKGIYLEQFDADLNVQASLKSDYAYYDETEQQWTLRGHVHALNLKGEQFDTEELIWAQKTHRIFSDSSIIITRAKNIIEGVGFDSNEDMSKYTILNPTGVFPIEDE
jgi:LPS export ABC transporter protein LptC